jgi:hypothetical protein
MVQFAATSHLENHHMKTIGMVLCGTIHFLLLPWPSALADTPGRDSFQLMAVFQLVFAPDPQVSPNGNQVVYVRNFMDIMKDKPRSHLWIINVDGNEHRPITTGDHNESSPRWSPRKWSQARCASKTAGSPADRPGISVREVDNLSTR